MWNGFEISAVESVSYSIRLSNLNEIQQQKKQNWIKYELRRKKYGEKILADDEKKPTYVFYIKRF